ncbi:MAG: heme-binding protein [Dehalococcoidia bacterium]
MKNEDARRILDAARAEATKMQKAVTITVVDAAGAPMVLERMDGATPMTTMVADAKAAGSAFTGRDSVLNRTMAENNPAMVALVSQRLAGRFAPVQGAVVLRRDGEVVGAVGVSGATAEEDEQIAKAGAAVVDGGQQLR